MFSERLANGVNVEGEVALFDEAIGPDATHQLAFPDYLAALFDQREQRVESFRRQRHHLAVAQQQPLANVKMERTELVSVCDWPPHRRSKNF